ncbi:MAG: ABC transporter ATP-binding protein [Alphaproteobacteria bacterium]|nr:ABC transporter ATP-binding protein [Alphaproteobacteria bacterium]
MSEQSLLIDNVSVAYAGKTAIDGISLDIRKGEVFGLMGLNGAGKTTLIKVLLGLRNADAGQVSIYGSPRTSKESKEKLAFLPEKFEPPWFLSGMEFLRFSLKLYRQSFHEDNVIEAARALALDTDALGRRVHTYSKGMRQKLGLLGTMLTDCPLFILDEPMSGLDPLARSLVKKMIASMRNENRTIFLSSHILADMDEICDRVAVLHNSKIRYVGAPAELKKMTGSQKLESAFLEFIEKNEAA